LLILRSILYLVSLITLAGAIEGLAGGKLGIHDWLSALPVYPDSPILALILGLVIFAVSEYIAYTIGEPPVILHIAAFIARTILVISAVVSLIALAGIVLSILATTGHLESLREKYPIVFLNLRYTWLSGIAWLGILTGAIFLYARLNPGIRSGWKDRGGFKWLRVDELEEVLEEEISPEEPGETMGPMMRRLTTRGIRPIYVERNPLEPLGRLAGDVGLLNIFVDTPTATWPEEQILLTIQSVREAMQWLENEAGGRVELNFKDIGHLRTPTPGWPATDRMRLTPKEIRHQVLEILGGIGIDGLEDLHYYLLRYSDEPGNITLYHFYLRAGSWCLPTMHPNIGMACCFHRHDPELTRPHFLDEEDLETFPELSCIHAHLILHFFGATDKPIRSIHPDIDIMSAVSLDINDLLIGFKTGKEIGW